jgi:hypothetical protein
MKVFRALRYSWILIVALMPSVVTAKVIKKIGRDEEIMIV